MDVEKIGKLIKKIRTKEGLSQQKFAEKYGVTYQAVSKWENGKNIPDILILKEICKEYKIDLEDLLEINQQTKTRKYKKTFIISIILILFITTCLLTLTHSKKNHSFEFKTISANCKNFELFGNIAYDKKQASISIAKISYCGKEDKRTYKKIDCTLYETNEKTKTEIDTYRYLEPEEISLEEFLKKVHFHIEHFEKTCKTYKENSLHLEIEATDEKDEITTYKIPLKLEDNCKDE